MAGNARFYVSPRDTDSTMPISPSSIIRLVPPEEKKRQADAGIGDGVGDYRHIQHCLQGHLHHKAHYQQRTEPIRCMRRQRDAPPQQQCKQQDHRAGSHKAKLLAQDGKDEVVLRFGHEQVLLAAAAKAKARRAPGADGIQALDGLVAVAQRVGKGIQP